MDSETGTYKELECSLKNFKEKNMGFWEKEGGGGTVVDVIDY